jgi:hypothetical protein
VKRSPGRPPLDDDEDSVPVNVRLPTSTYDEVYRLARMDHITVPEQIRRTIHATIPPPKQLKNQK